MSNLRKSLALSFAQRNSTLVIQFVSSLIIARLLTPHEVGIFSIGAVIVSFSHILRDMGVSNYVIQERELTRERIRSAQAIVWMTSLTLAFLLFALSAWAGAFYAEPGVTLTMRVLSINFLLLPVGSVTSALLSREMAFGKLFVVNFMSALTQAVSGIALAWAGFGFISLAWSAVASSVVAAVGMTICRQKDQPWLPGFREWRRVFSAGSKLSATSIFNEIGLGGPELVTGRILGFEVVAYFSRGFGAGMLALRALVDSFLPVAIPYFAKQARSDNDLKEPYLRGVAYMSALAIPAFSGLAIMAEPIILFLYGGQWLRAVLPLQIICTSMAFLAICNVSGSLLVGSGKIGSNLKIQMICQPLKVLLVVIGAFSDGLAGVALGVAVGDIILAISGFTIANRLIGVTATEFLLALFPSFGIALGCSGVCWGLMRVIDLDSILLKLFSVGACMAVTWIVGLFLLRHPMRQEVSGLLCLLKRES